jgi:competence protein ComEA
MSTKLCFGPPPTLAAMAVVLFLAVLLSREASTTEALPAFLPLAGDYLYVELVGEGLAQGTYQFNDGLSFFDVIKLTAGFSSEDLLTNPVLQQIVRDGESLKIVRKDREIGIIRQGWMKASHRMALGILLHPDRMSRTDWTVLPGVGDALAERIEIERQKNGDYGGVEALVRVKGIGKRRIDSWIKFFVKV